MSRPQVSLASVLLVLLSAQGALAQRRPGGSAAFDRGVAALEAGRYQAAVSDLEEAVRVDPAPLAIYNLGLAYRGVGRSADAVAAFERYVAAPERRASPAVLSAVRREIETLRAGLATLTVETDPPEATVIIDGRPAGDVRRGVSLDAGSHQVEVSAPGRRTQRQAVGLRAGARERVNVRLAAEADGAPTAAAAPDTWGQLIVRGVANENNLTAQELAGRDHELTERRAVRSRVRLILYGQVGLGVAVADGFRIFELATGLGVGVRYSLSERWDLQVRAAGSLYPSVSDGRSGATYSPSTDPYQPVDFLTTWMARLDFGVRVRPTSALSPWQVGFGVSGGMWGLQRANYGVDFGATQSTYVLRGKSEDVGGLFGGYLETGFVFGSKEQWDLGIRVGLNGPSFLFVDSLLYLGWAVL